MNQHLRNLRVSELRRCPIQLRPVRKETVDYMMLKDSIRALGILQPLLVRPVNDGHEVVAGNNRFECAIDLRFEEVPCLIRELSDEQVEDLQVVENSNRVATNPIDYVRRLQKIVNRGDETVEELAFRIHRHPDWVRNLLSLNCLSPKCKQAIDNREFPLSIGIELAKLPLHKQDELLLFGFSLTSREFLEMIRSVVRRMRADGHLQRNNSVGEVGPWIKKWRVLLDEYINKTNAATVLMRANAEMALDGWEAAIEWVLSMDEKTVAERVARRDRAKNLKAKNNTSRILELKEKQNE